MFSGKKTRVPLLAASQGKASEWPCWIGSQPYPAEPPVSSQRSSRGGRERSGGPSSRLCVSPPPSRGWCRTAEHGGSARLPRLQRCRKPRGGSGREGPRGGQGLSRGALKSEPTRLPRRGRLSGSSAVRVWGAEAAGPTRASPAPCATFARATFSGSGSAPGQVTQGSVAPSEVTWRRRPPARLFQRAQE